MLAVALPVAAQEAVSFTLDGVTYAAEAGATECRIASVQKAATGDANHKLTIAATVQNGGVTYTVAAVGDGAFEGCDKLEAIALPAGVKSLGKAAFKGCSQLYELTLPKVTEAYLAPEEGIFSDVGIFYGCENLSKINILDLTVSPDLKAVLPDDACVTFVGSDGQGTKVYQQQNAAMFYARRLSDQAVEIRGMTIVESNTTKRCQVPATFKLGTEELNVTTIAADAFSLIDNVHTKRGEILSVTFPEGLTTIGARAFAEQTSLSSVTFPRSLTSVGEDAFLGFDGSITVSTNDNKPKEAILKGLPVTANIMLKPTTGSSLTYSGPVEQTPDAEAPSNKLTYYGYYQQGTCRLMRAAWSGEVTVPAEVQRNGEATVLQLRSVDARAFAESGVSGVTLPEGVTTIGPEAFSGCTGLRKLVIPASVTTVGAGALNGCRQLELTIPAELCTAALLEGTGTRPTFTTINLVGATAAQVSAVQALVDDLDPKPTVRSVRAALKLPDAAATSESEEWFDIRGRRLAAKPTAPGVYIRGFGRKAKLVRIK